jgi:hypothetical protein
MKKIIIATLIICVVFCMLLSHKEYRNYKITNITLSEIVIKDSLLNLRKGNRYFLLEFMVDYCNSSLTFMGGGIEPGLNGIIPSEYAAAQCIVNVGEDFISLAPYLKATHEGNVQDNSVVSGNYTYSEALKYFWFMDGTPFGIKKTENSILQLP